jgi:hypothetical protein
MTVEIDPDPVTRQLNNLGKSRPSFYGVKPYLSGFSGILSELGSSHSVGRDDGRSGLLPMADFRITARNGLVSGKLLLVEGLGSSGWNGFRRASTLELRHVCG